MISELELQGIIGTDTRNPYLTVCKTTNGNLQVYYGGNLMEEVKNDFRHLSFRVIIGMLYNCKVNRKKLSEVFVVSPKTIKKWGDALHEEDPEQTLKLLKPQGNRKLNVEIMNFARCRFKAIYQRNKSSYSKQIREEIQETHDVSLSSEVLRPLFNKWKEEIKSENEESLKKNY